QELGDAFDDAEQKGGEEIVQGVPGDGKRRRERGKREAKRNRISAAPFRCFRHTYAPNECVFCGPAARKWRPCAVRGLARRLRIQSRLPSPSSRLLLATASGAPPCPPTRPSKNSSATTRSNSSTCALPTCGACSTT